MQETESQSGAAEQRDEETSGLGARLRAERKRQNLSLEQIAEELRLEPRVLHALEDERFDDLVAPVFARGYLRQYGRKLGLDRDGLLRDYDRLTGHTDVELTPSRGAAVGAAEPQAGRRWMFVLLLVMLLAAVGAGAFWWFGGVEGFAERFGLASNTTNPAALPYPASAVSETEPEEPPVRPEARLARPPATVDPEPDGPSLAEFIRGQTPQRPGSVDIADGVGQASPPDAVDPVDQAERDDPAVPGDGADPAATAGPVSTVDDLAGYETIEAALTFVADSWAEVTDARGVRLVYDLGLAGEERTVVGAAPIEFLFGNAPGVELLIDGRPYVLPARATPGTVVGFTVEASGD